VSLDRSVERALVGVLIGYLDDVLFHMVAPHMMEMPIVQVIDMISVTHGGVTAGRTMPVIVTGVACLSGFTHVGLQLHRVLERCRPDLLQTVPSMRGTMSQEEPSNTRSHLSGLWREIHDELEENYPR
jgi:hypothetical protein